MVLTVILAPSKFFLSSSAARLVYVIHKILLSGLLRQELLRLYCNAAIEKCYFCNSDYGNANPMEVFAFKKLFNFQNIPAIRELDDSESDSSKGISKRVISLLKDNDTYTIRRRFGTIIY